MRAEEKTKCDFWEGKSPFWKKKKKKRKEREEFGSTDVRTVKKDLSFQF